jgi:diaminopimelate decarboxylase
MTLLSPADIDLSLYPEGTTLDDDGRLVVGGCRVADLADEFGTPMYLIDEQALRAQARRYVAAFASRHPDSQVLFATKSYPTPSVVRVLVEEGCGVDVAAEGELLVALTAGVDPAKVVLHGNAKTDADIRAALTASVGHIVVDNTDDIERIARLSRTDVPVPVLLRVSPKVAAATHAAMMTGHDESKFGIPSSQVADVITEIRATRQLELRGLHAHVGSQLLDVNQFVSEVESIAGYGRFPVYDLGGGLGVRYESSDDAPDVDDYAEHLVGAVHRHLGEDVRLFVEPGRSMVARSGITVYRIVTVKHGPRVHAAVDGGMGDNLEVSLYGQPFQPSVIDRSGEAETVDVEGRHCESGDRIAHDVTTVAPRIGDLLTVPVTGAYCYTMSNNYNGARRPPVIFASDGAARAVVRRETFDDVYRRDVLYADRLAE